MTVILNVLWMSLRVAHVNCQQLFPANYSSLELRYVESWSTLLTNCKQFQFSALTQWSFNGDQFHNVSGYKKQRQETVCQRTTGQGKRNRGGASQVSFVWGK